MKVLVNSRRSALFIEGSLNSEFKCLFSRIVQSFGMSIPPAICLITVGNIKVEGSGQ